MSSVLNAKFVDVVPDVLRRSMLDEWNKYCFNYGKENSNMISVKIGDTVCIQGGDYRIFGKEGTIVNLNFEWDKPYAVKIEGLPNPDSMYGTWYLKEDEFYTKYVPYGVKGMKWGVRRYQTTHPCELAITNVKFNPPATIVFWADGTKTVVKSNGTDIYDPEKGLAMAIVKKALGNKGNYYNVFKKWICENANFSDPHNSEIADDIYDNG